MLLFDQTPPSKNFSTEDRQDDAILNIYHVKFATACLLMSYWVIWIITTIVMISSYDVTAVKSSWKWIDCIVFLILIALHGLILILATFGWLSSSPLYCTLLIIPPLSCGGAISGLTINYWISKGAMSMEYCLTSPTILGFLSLWVFVVYAIVIISKYCEYLHELQSLKRKRKGFNIDVFKERVFPTPPLKEFNRMEFARCANLSDSNIDDIFGVYEPNVTLS